MHAVRTQCVLTENKGSIVFVNVAMLKSTENAVRLFLCFLSDAYHMVH